MLPADEKSLTIGTTVAKEGALIAEDALLLCLDDFLTDKLHSLTPIGFWLTLGSV